MAQQQDAPVKTFPFLEAMPSVLRAALDLMVSKGRTYGDSWKARGGRGAWYTLVRPLDRLQLVMERDFAGDIFAAIEAEPSGGDGSVLDMVRDLRNYLSLVEAEMVARGVVKLPEPDDAAEPGPAYVDQDAGDVTGRREGAAGTLGAGPVTDGCYTTLDLGTSRTLWYEGLGALPPDVQFQGTTTLSRGDINRLESAAAGLQQAGALVASRQLETGNVMAGDFQIIIRIPRR